MFTRARYLLKTKCFMALVDCCSTREVQIVATLIFLKAGSSTAFRMALAEKLMRMESDSKAIFYSDWRTELAVQLIAT